MVGRPKKAGEKLIGYDSWKCKSLFECEKREENFYIAQSEDIHIVSEGKQYELLGS